MVFVNTVSFEQAPPRSTPAQYVDKTRNTFLDNINKCFEGIRLIKDVDIKIFIATTKTLTTLLDKAGNLYDGDLSVMFRDVENRDNSIRENSIRENKVYQIFKKRFLLNRSIQKTMSTRRIEGGRNHRSRSRGRGRRGHSIRSGRPDRRGRRRQRSHRQVGGMKWRQLLDWALLAISSLQAASFTVFTVDAIVNQREHLKENLRIQFRNEEDEPYDVTDVMHQIKMADILGDYFSVVNNIDGHCVFNAAIMMNYPIQDVGNVMKEVSETRDGDLGMRSSDMYEKIYKEDYSNFVLEPLRNQDDLLREVGKEVWKNYNQTMSTIDPDSVDSDVIITFELSIRRHAVVGLVRKRQFPTTGDEYLVGIMDMNSIDAIFRDAYNDLHSIPRIKSNRTKSFIRVPPDFFDESDQQILGIFQETTMTPMQDILDYFNELSGFVYALHNTTNPPKSVNPLQTVIQLYNITHVEVENFVGILKEAEKLRQQKLDRRAAFERDALSLTAGVGVVSLATLFDLILDKPKKSHVKVLPTKLPVSIFESQKIPSNTSLTIRIFVHDKRGIQTQRRIQTRTEYLILSEHSLECTGQDTMCEQRLDLTNNQSFISHEGKWIRKTDSRDADVHEIVSIYKWV